MPSQMETADGKRIGFHYEGEQWDWIYWQDGGRTTLTREETSEGWQLQTFAAPGMADGYGESLLTKQADGSIVIDSRGEPFFEPYRKRLVPDATGLPVRLLLPDSVGYVQFTYDASQRLSGITRYRLPDATPEYLLQFTYDNRRGTMSGIDAPEEWLKVYLSYCYLQPADAVQAQFLNWRHNVTSITEAYPREQRSEEYTFRYEYNAEGYPITVTDRDGRRVRIRY